MKKKKCKALIFALFFLFLSQPVLFAQEQRRAPEIRSKVWFNTGSYKKNPSMKILRGKVVLIFFWTLYDPTSENVARYLNKWWEEYKGNGFEILGVHTPEWGFNNSVSELYRKVDELGVKFPIVIDGNSSIRAAYGMFMWPSFCLVDRDGYIREQYNGIGRWRDMRKMVETLLEESGYDPRLRRAQKREDMGDEKI
ncbi:MAG TPA: redoxin family protein [Candidatus Omnitrophota bacterium]|nr:redoxin family protein [Candidatus Omnitrophota bacterium]